MFPVGTFVSNGVFPRVNMGIPSTMVVSINSLRSHTGVSGTQSAENAEAALLAFNQGLNEVTIDDPGYVGNQVSYVGTGPSAIRVIRRGSTPSNITVTVPGGFILNGGVTVPTVVHQSVTTHTFRHHGHGGGHGGGSYGSSYGRSGGHSGGGRSSSSHGGGGCRNTSHNGGGRSSNSHGGSYGHTGSSVRSSSRHDYGHSNGRHLGGHDGEQHVVLSGGKLASFGMPPKKF